MANYNSSNKVLGTTKNRSIQDTILGKMPPQALDLEQAILGAIMIEKNALSDIIDVITNPEIFYKDAHQRIYAAIIALFVKSEPIDLLTVSSQLRATGELEQVGGALFLTELTERVSSAANILFHARIILEMSIKRQLIGICTNLQNNAFEDTSDAFLLLDKLESDLFQLSETHVKNNYKDMTSIMKEALKELENKKDLKDGLTGIGSGFSSLDRITSGWQKTELIILAARPGMGKTAFVVSALRNAAIIFKHAVAIFSLEMSSVQLVNRLISAEAEIEGEKLRKGNLLPHEWQQLHSGIGELSSAPIFIDDTPALSILELRAKCRRLKAQHDIKLIVIDYLQLMTGDSSGKGASGNREQEIASISRALKNLAKELDVPVIALAQLSRAVETRGGDKKPQLSDLRESGSIEQDADMVMFLYRPEYYGITEVEGKPVNGLGELIIAKNRSGSLETVQLKFIGKYTKYTNYDDSEFGFGGAASSVLNDIASVDTFENAQTFPSAMNQQSDITDLYDNSGDSPF